ncbi:MAG: MFS transporter [Chloroflexota bacterium]
MASITTPEIKFQSEIGYWATCFTHFCIDFLNNGRSILMAVLAVALGMSNAQVGFILIIYNIGNALSQPFFGMLADRIGPKRLVVGGMLWMVFFSALTAVLPSWPAVFTLTAAGLGSGMFHPAGTTIATRPDFSRRNLATGLFFFFGSAGLFVGPIAAGYFLEIWDRPGYMLSAGLAATAFVLGLATINDGWFHHLKAIDLAQPEKAANKDGNLKIGWGFIPVLMTIAGYSSVGIIVMTYLPKLLIESDTAVSTAGFVTGSFLFGTMLGTLSGGMLADYLPGRTIILLGMLGAILPLWFGVPATGAIQIGLLFLSGFLAALPHSTLVLMIQSIFPKGRGFASGLALGGMFFIGSVFSYIAGAVADTIGLQVTLQGAGVLPLISAAMVFFLPAVLLPSKK